MDDLTDKVEKITEAQEQPETGVESPDADGWRTDPDYLRLMSHFAIDSREAGWYKDKLSVVMDWAKTKAQSKDIVDALVEIKGLQRELGFTSLEKHINEVYRWIRLDQDEKRIQKEKGLLNGVRANG